MLFLDVKPKEAEKKRGEEKRANAPSSVNTATVFIDRTVE